MSVTTTDPAQTMTKTPVKMGRDWSAGAVQLKVAKEQGRGVSSRCLVPQMDHDHAPLVDRRMASVKQNCVCAQQVSTALPTATGAGREATHDERAPQVPVLQDRVSRRWVQHLDDLVADCSQVAHLVQSGQVSGREVGLGEKEPHDGLRNGLIQRVGSGGPGERTANQRPMGVRRLGPPRKAQPCA